MANNFDDANVKCPFFSKTKNERIICEGITDECISVLKFENKKELDKHKTRYCNSHYTECALYKAVEGKYVEKK